ncbi:hypothetical protein MRB53_031151 [Persea americana]|uniref:Uncharacterized protein n=1 Tax=Persea americana TaxID=3435 RepID=A0ACC2KP96_PERAE|nr:hypothetical protein MRB53_031151 [Persea americana]
MDPSVRFDCRGLKIDHGALGEIPWHDPIAVELRLSFHVCKYKASLLSLMSFGSSIVPSTKQDLFFARSAIVMARSHVLKLSPVRSGETRTAVGLSQ